MEIICAQSGIAPMELSGFGIRDIAGAGFELVTLDMNLLYPASEFDRIRKDVGIGNKKNIRIWEDPRLMREEIRLIRKKYEEYGLKIKAVRAPFFPRSIEMHRFLTQEAAGQMELLKILMRINTECIRLCGEVGCRCIIIPPACCHASDEAGVKLNEKYYLALADAATKNGVTILIENQYLDFNGHLIRGAFSDSAKAAAFIDKLNKDVGGEVFGFCLDTGVCTLCGQDLQEYVRPLGKRIKSMIVRDCDGQHDDALLPFTCVSRGRSKTDWLSLVRGLREIAYDGQLIFDMKDTASAFRPLLIQPLLKLARTVADYLAWQIGIEKQLEKYSSVVLFGAGNMCRDFMKCYGEKYPPLFTCDNNSGRWGEYFCGLEIKPPDALRTLPEDCGVFICNIYYNEIAEQLKDMGVRNIEFFNNEYMPSFYFENLEMWRDDKDRSTDKGSR